MLLPVGAAASKSLPDWCFGAVTPRFVKRGLWVRIPPSALSPLGPLQPSSIPGDCAWPPVDRRPGAAGCTRPGAAVHYCWGGAASRITAPRSSLSTSTANRSTGCCSGVLTLA